jgi:hypothetical protein
MSETPLLELPYLAASQAQKHVTHNEALTLLDGLVHLSVISRALATPPSSPANGARYLVASSPTGDWTGHAGKIALRMDGAWRFLVPREGWRLWIEDEDTLLTYNGTAWIAGSVPSELQNLSLLGVNATADAANRLTVSSPATLFNHQGTGHQVKINKNVAADTASFLFQTGFSGRAEFGTTGDDNFHLKVSPNGTSWLDAMAIDATSGIVTFAQGVQGLAYAPKWAERRLIATQALANNTAMQDWFASAGGLPLASNSTYEFDALFMSLNGVTSHGLNMQFAAISGGSILWDFSGAKVTMTSQTSAVRRGTTNTFNASRNVTTASTVGGNTVAIKGVVITGAGGGTLRPQVAQTAASGDFTVQPGTYFRARKIGADTLTNTGEWA